MSAALVSVAPKLRKLLPMLASDKDGEVVATARAIGRTLHQAGADFHDLAAAVARAESSPIGTPQYWLEIPAAERTAWLIEMRTCSRLSPWERNFCEFILAQVLYRPWTNLTAKQVAVLDRCVDKMVEAS